MANEWEFTIIHFFFLTRPNQSTDWHIYLFVLRARLISIIVKYESRNILNK